jgi:ribosomal protein S3
MGQKTNPIVLRIGKSQDWKSKYFEKKSTEIASHTFKNYEIKRYIQQIFKNYGLTLHTCKLNYKNFSLHIFVSYYLPPKFLFKTNVDNNLAITSDLNFKKYFNYQQIIYKKTLKNFSENKKLLYRIAKFKNKNFKYIEQKQLLTLNNYFKTVNLTKSNAFIDQITESLGLFTQKKLDIFLTFQQLNKNVIYNKKIFELIKRKILNLRRFNEADFFNEGIATLIICITKKDSADLLSEFIATQLKKQKKRHNQFLRFLKNLLAAFCTQKFSIIKGIQVKIKGKFNRAARAKHRILKIGQVPIMNLNSKISYSERTSYAQNGTFGVKTWLIEK